MLRLEQEIMMFCALVCALVDYYDGAQSIVVYRKGSIRTFITRIILHDKECCLMHKSRWVVMSICCRAVYFKEIKKSVYICCAYTEPAFFRYNVTFELSISDMQLIVFSYTRICLLFWCITQLMHGECT